jgi:hypothetical protein
MSHFSWHWFFSRRFVRETSPHQAHVGRRGDIRLAVATGWSAPVFLHTVAGSAEAHLVGGTLFITSASANPIPGGAAPNYAAAGSVSAEPAEWRTYDLLLDFQDLPRTYSCDELWYKFRDVLRKLGARAYMTITPYDCGYLGGGEARSPHVEVKFQLPQPLQGAATRYAQISVIDQPVRLAPGAPRTLLPSDCEFVRQLQGTLLAALPLHVTVADFDCSAAPASFALTVDALLAARAASRHAQTVGAAPRPYP